MAASRPSRLNTKASKTSRKKPKVCCSPKLYGDRFDSGNELLQRLKKDLSSITNDKADPKSSKFNFTPLNHQIAEITKQRDAAIKKGSALAIELKKIMEKRVDEGEELVRCVQRIVTVSKKPGYIEYPPEKKPELEPIKKITTELENLQREIDNMNIEIEKLRKDERKRQQKQMDALNRHCLRMSDQRTGKAPPKNKTVTSDQQNINTQVTSFKQWFSDYGSPKLKNNVEGQPMLSTFKKSKVRLKNYGIKDDGKPGRTTGCTSLGSTLKRGTLIS
uniref:Uncharacterized protein n=1 Tax=Lotharella globosa TaxID=91324 RepID=A0A7S4DKF7_9EUKA|mmetsp:Transcript_8582/g.16617  ORF Transcript_8582/g.16617 Transcript_8582/m.16617 type:complete len:276 (+) Transcript_8582:84-911(+)